jgi:peptidoglycan/LPS O-acetylase OafA/YrhL
MWSLRGLPLFLLLFLLFLFFATRIAEGQSDWFLAALVLVAILVSSTVAASVVRLDDSIRRGRRRRDRY